VPVKTSFCFAAVELEKHDGRMRARLFLLIACVPLNIHERRKHFRDPTGARTKANAVASHQCFSLFTGQGAGGASVAFARLRPKEYTGPWNSGPWPPWEECGSRAKDQVIPNAS
jgi:hypothetical protein